MPHRHPRGLRQRQGAQAAEARAPLLAGAAALAASECRKVLRRLRVVTDKREKRREGLPFARMLAKASHANALAVFDAIVGLARPAAVGAEQGASPSRGEALHAGCRPGAARRCGGGAGGVGQQGKAVHAGCQYKGPEM